MAKKKSIKKTPQKANSTKTKNSNDKDTKKRPLGFRWYIWVIIALLLFAVASQAYKFVVTKNDIALLDKAEEKMRQLNFPGGEKTEIERYCSERSVKFGSPGKPTCGVSIKASYDKSQTISNHNTKEIQKSLKDFGVRSSVRDENTDRVYYNLTGFNGSLVCYMGDVLSKDYIKNDNYQHIAIYCQKEFQSKVYPIRN